LNKEEWNAWEDGFQQAIRAVEDHLDVCTDCGPRWSGMVNMKCIKTWILQQRQEGGTLWLGT